MDAGDDRCNEADGLRLVRAFLSLPPDKRRMVLELVDQLAQAAERRDEAAKGRPG